MIVDKDIGFTASWITTAIYSNQVRSIAGQVTKLNIGFPCRVRLFERQTGVFLKEVLSDNNGNYHFDNVSSSFEYTIIAHDHQRQYNAVIQDMVKPV